MLAGNYKYIEQAESDIAHFFGARCGLIFNSGYDANVGLFASVPQKGDTVIHDQLIHASIIDGIRLSHAQRLSFKHNDVADLEKKIRHAQGRVFVAVESVYSMDGDRAPLAEISALCAREGAHLIVDEAHATGVLGPDGAGVVKELQLETQCFARVYTFGKAVGCHGAIVVGSWALHDYLINFARSFIYTTALPASAIATVMQSLSLLRNMDVQREYLRHLVQYFRSKIPADRLTQSDTPIQAIITPGNQRVKLLALRLQAAGLDVRAVLHPTVAVGAERLRVVLHVFNTTEEIDQLSRIVAEEVSDNGG
ncbi:aminotransferase class I/II-fold pyridoxal phosphate-dependent enzyme [Chitinophaga sedimenti]|uniref:aminotransferase class I/II-fold pyridoxal phosphate-dependent enzyme n=1 Tax=Chitinophaga sedimenti TaxID=2033606 RepID=UPI002004C154|nr:aminotransferase class I/II-fold pyridoxal phosphate-dependent enzyme [Chitinophaga sedimenti]MCK7556375.1 aminotransferase class I/II-fold pyridoxal phosphate-dependent enzyme [Chitinophaga sedimenti]